MRVNKTLTITAGTPVNIYTETSVGDPSFLDLYGKQASRVFMQMKHGGSGLGYVMSGCANRVPSSANSSDVSAELQPATATAPGGTWSDPASGSFADTPSCVPVNGIWVDGSHTGDQVIVSYDLKD